MRTVAAKLLEILLAKYADQSCIYLSWDAASWHLSKKLFKRVEEINSDEYRIDHPGPIVKLAPLPSCAQFLNVIKVIKGSVPIIDNSAHFSILLLMARKLRVEYPGAIYHVINRGDRREPIFKDDTDRQRFTETLGETCQKTGWQVHAWCLMDNHFHLVVETPQSNLVAGMKWLLGTYTSRFNRRHKVFGHLFSGRYKALVVDGSGTGYLRTVCEYVHLNPVRAKLLAAEEPLRKYPWSSFPLYLASAGRRPDWLRVDRVLGEEGIPKDSPAGRREFERRLEERRRQEEPEVYAGIRRGWCLGEEAFRQELLERMEGKMGTNHYGAERAESQEQRAQRLVAEELQRRKWTEETLGAKKKGDWGKLEMARRLRQETVMPLAWIAERLQMGSVAYLNNRLHLLGTGKLRK